MPKAEMVPVVFETTAERRKQIEKAVREMKQKAGRGSMRTFIEDAIDEKIKSDSK